MAKPPHSACDPDEIEGICIHYLSDNGKAQFTTQRSSNAGERKIARGTHSYTIRENALFLHLQGKVLGEFVLEPDNAAWLSEVSTPPVAAAVQASAIKRTFARRSLAVQEPCENTHEDWQR